MGRGAGCDSLVSSVSSVKEEEGWSESEDVVGEWGMGISDGVVGKDMVGAV